MGTRARLGLAVGAILFGWTLGLPTAALETGSGGQPQATSTPQHHSTAADDLIYDFVGPNTVLAPQLKESTP